MEANIFFGILEITGGILCAVGDMLFDLKGKGNEKLGTSEQWAEKVRKCCEI